MLRHKYTKKRLRKKYNQKKRTRKHGGTKNPRKTISPEQRKEAMRLSTPNTLSSKISPRDERDAQIRMANLLDGKCEAAKHVNDDGSIDCPNKRSNAIKKMSKFHNDRGQNSGCEPYANDMMANYNETCYGDDTNPNRKWDKNNKNYRNEEAAKAGFYPGEASAAADFSEQPMVATLQPQETVPAATVSKEVYEPIKVTKTQQTTPNPAPIKKKKVEPMQSPTFNVKKPSKFSEKQKKFCEDKVKKPHKDVPGHIHSKNRKDTTNCIIKNRKDPVICGVKKVKNKKNVKMCVPKKENPHLKQNKTASTAAAAATPAATDTAEKRTHCFEEIKRKDGPSYYAEKNKQTGEWRTDSEARWDKPKEEEMCTKNVSASDGSAAVAAATPATTPAAATAASATTTPDAVATGDSKQSQDDTCFVEQKDENGNPYYA